MGWISFMIGIANVISAGFCFSGVIRDAKEEDWSGLKLYSVLLAINIAAAFLNLSVTIGTM